MSSYGLLEHFDQVSSGAEFPAHEPLTGRRLQPLDQPNLFKDKKLNKLWAKAELAGFSAAELQALKEEFMHHQEKVDQYFSILNEVEGSDSKLNEIEQVEMMNEVTGLHEEGEPLDKGRLAAQVNLLKAKHLDVKDDFDRLHRLTAQGPKGREFIEPKVQGLWKLAVQANFSAGELHSLKSELHHYEKRLLKLRHLQVEHAVAQDNLKNQPLAGSQDELQEAATKIDKHTRKVAKLHMDLESRIMARHSEL